MIIPGRTITVKYHGEYVEFIPRPEQGAWYEIRRAPYQAPRFGEIGMMMMPMLIGGEPDLGQIGEIEVPYADA